MCRDRTEPSIYAFALYKYNTDKNPFIYFELKPIFSIIVNNSNSEGNWKYILNIANINSMVYTLSSPSKQKPIYKYGVICVCVFDAS